jgi:hypothetical protein
MRKILIALATGGMLLAGGVAAANADAPSGNSGHFNNGDTQCQNSPSNPNCPPVGK